MAPIWLTTPSHYLDNQTSIMCTYHRFLVVSQLGILGMWIVWLGNDGEEITFERFAASCNNAHPCAPKEVTNTGGLQSRHMCPSGDRTATEKDNAATFVMTNIIHRQSPQNNQGPWAALEVYCRELVKRRKKNCIFGCGGYGKQRGTLDQRPACRFRRIHGKLLLC